MDLGQRQSRVLKMNLLRTPAIRDLVQNDLGDLHLRAANPGDALAVEFNLRGEDNGHGFSPGSRMRPEPAGAVLPAVEADCPPRCRRGCQLGDHSRHVPWTDVTGGFLAGRSLASGLPKDPRSSPGVLTKLSVRTYNLAS